MNSQVSLRHISIKGKFIPDLKNRVFFARELIIGTPGCPTLDMRSTSLSVAEEKEDGAIPPANEFTGILASYFNEENQSGLRRK